MKLLFTHSYFYRFDPKQWANKTPYPPLGTIYAASWMRTAGHEVDLYDVALKENVDDLAPVVAETGPDMLIIYDDGFNYLTKMCLTNMREAAFEMARMASSKGIPVAVCSSDSTDHYEKYLDNGCSYVILGEGEMTLKDLVATLESNGDISGVRGIVYRKDGETIQTDRRPVIKELDDLSPPAWDLIDVASYRSIWKQGKQPFTLNIATTRGCPYKCNWCAKPIYGNRYNSRSAIRAVDEVEYHATHHGVTRFWMCDDIFGLKPGWVQAFRDELQRRNLKISYVIQSRADLLLQDDNLQALAESGLREVWMGAESGSQKILDAMDKGITIDQIREATKMLRKHGIKVAFFLQFGYLGETREDIESTLQMVSELKPDNIGVSVSYPLPGTLFYDKVKAELEEKANWTDSDELALMFQNTFNRTYYKTLHRFIHRTFRTQQGVRTLKNGLSTRDGGNLRSALLLPYYFLSSLLYKRRLNTLENVS